MIHKTQIVVLSILLLSAASIAANPNDGTLVQINSTHWYFATMETGVEVGLHTEWCDKMVRKSSRTDGGWI